METHARSTGCELCPALAGAGDHRFARMYAGYARSRIVEESASFVALPTLGQLFPGSMLILPRVHIEPLAAVPEGEWLELEELISRVERPLADRGEPMLFQHGSTARAAGGCGIHHARVHVVPVPTGLLAD